VRQQALSHGGKALKRTTSITLSVLASLGLGACASTPKGETFSKLVEPRAEVALLYLYRPDEYYGKGLAFKVAVDGQEKGDIGNGGYLVIPLTPGKHAIQVKGLAYKDEPRDIEVQKGGIDFLKVVTTKGFGGFTAKLTLEGADRAKAVSDLKPLKREPERYIDKEI
jgi:hypothetical protein